MNMKTKLLFLITFLSLTIISCNKDEEEIYYDFGNVGGCIAVCYGGVAKFPC